MNVKTIKKLVVLKRACLNKWYFCMKPIAKLIKKIDAKKSAKKSAKKYDRLENMTFEEVIKIYVKHTVKYMVKRKDATEIYYCCTKKNGYAEYYEDNFILSDLSGFGYSRFTKTKLNGWYYTNKECQAIGYGEGSKDRWLAIENKLRELAEKEFIRVGCTVEYVDESDKLSEYFVKESGYEKTMRVTIR